MLQRIQTIFMTIGAVACAMMLSFPFARTVNVDSVTQVMAFGLNHQDSTGLGETFSIPWIIILGILSSVLLVLFVVAIMRYKNRMQQIRILMIGMIINLLLIGAVFLVAGKLPGDVSYGMSTYLALLAMLMITLSNRFIRRDEAKVRSADRLR